MNPRFYFLKILLPCILTITASGQQADILSLETRFRERPRSEDIETQVRAYEGDVVRYNQVLAQLQRDIESRIRDFDQRSERLNRQIAEITTLRERIDAPVLNPDERNRISDRHNSLVERFHRDQTALKEAQEAFLKEKREREARLARESERLDQEKARLDAQTRRLNQANKDRDELAIWRELNQLWERETALSRPSPINRRILNLRQEIMAQAKRDSQRKTFPEILVDVDLPNGVRALLILDTGAETTTLTPAVARAAGVAFSDARRESFLVANGESVLKPVGEVAWMRVEGESVRNVKVAIGTELHPGIDGLLGRSFLHHFDYQVLSGETPNFKIMGPKREE